MDKNGCDYGCKTVGEGITKYRISDSWSAEFVASDAVYPIVVVQVAQIRKSPAMMNLQLRMMENTDDELAGCMVLPQKHTNAFKIETMHDLIRAMETMPTKG